MQNSSRQLGFGIVEILITVAVMAVVGLLGWKAWDAYTSDSSDQTASQSETSEQTVPDIHSAEDLNTVDQMLDDTNVDGEYEQELETETNF